MGSLAKLVHPATYRKPELLFRPAQILRRLRWRPPRDDRDRDLPTAWGLTVTASPGDRIGEALAKTGSYDTAVLEVLARLIEPGETCLDVGANFGLVAGVMALASGAGGKVVAFEPHPELRQRLEGHLDRWRSNGAALAAVQIEAAALSNRPGEAQLFIPEEFSSNEGSASLERGAADRAIKVQTARLDAVVEDSDKPIGVLKIDIEGHEKAALEGAAGLLRKRAIRDVVYEDHGGYPSPVSELLEGHGYRVWLIRKGLLKPLLMAPGTKPYELPNYLATTDSERAARRMRAFGYRVLSGSLRSNCERSG